MENNYINFRKTREFGDVFNDTFVFLKQEAKPLGLALLIFALPLLLIGSIGMAFIQGDQIKTAGNLDTFNMWAYFSKIAVFFIISIAGHTMLIVTLYSYCRLYLIKGARNFNNNELFSEILRKFLPTLGASIVFGLIIGVGFAMCIIPGIYLGISLSMLLPIMIIENQGFGYSFSRSFDLTHKQWWWTFLIIFVYIVLVFVFYMIVSIPTFLFGMKDLFSLQNPEEINEKMSSFLIIYNALATISSSFVAVILHVAILFQYFNIVELYEGHTLSHKIDQLTRDEATRTE